MYMYIECTFVNLPVFNIDVIHCIEDIVINNNTKQAIAVIQSGSYIPVAETQIIIINKCTGMCIPQVDSG